jgi:aspartate carbamoyltransferase regulatory subunit
MTCEYCHKDYNPETISIPNPLPDGMCAYCGTQLTEEEVAALIAEFNATRE